MSLQSQTLSYHCALLRTALRQSNPFQAFVPLTAVVRVDQMYKTNNALILY